MLALEGIKIVDLGKAAPSTFCTMILGDMGAEVIKVEAPPGASRLRASSGDGDERRNVLYQATGRNKKSIGLNLKLEEARHIVYQLAEGADVIVEGYRPGVVKRLGVDYETINRLNPGIVYCSITSYGQDGPYRDRIAHDINSDAMAGALDLIGEKGGRPVVPLNLLADLGGGGMCAVIGILAALMSRNITGKGQVVDISMLDSVILLLSGEFSNYFRTNTVSKRGETKAGAGGPDYNIYQTKDGKYFSIGNAEPYLWEAFCREIGKEDFIPYQMDTEKWGEISAYFEQLFLTKTRDEWFDLLFPKNLFVGKVLSIDEVAADPQVLHRQMVVEVEHPTEGKVKQPGIAIKLSETPGKVRSLAPLLGEHTDEILSNLGYDEGKINEMRQSGVIS